MNFHEISSESKIAVAGGTLLNAIVNVPGEDLINAIVVASVGAVSSFVVTFLCKWVAGLVRRKPSSK